MEERYNIYFSGQVLEGHDIAQVRLQLAKLFKADDTTLDKLFSGSPQLIKRNCDKDTALKYQQAMKKAGAKPVIRAAEAAAPPTPPVDTPAGETTAATTEEGEFDLAPAGADVLRPEERAEPEVLEVDTSALSLAATGERLSEEPPAPPAAPDTDHLSMGDVGDDIPNLDTGPIPDAPDTSNIALTPEGTDFSDCTPEPSAAPAVDLSELELAEHGADMLEEKYRDQEKPKPPATDHLSLE